MKRNVLNLSDSAVNGRNGKQLVYVLDCIENSTRAQDENQTFETDCEVIKFFFDCFESEYNYKQNKQRFPNLQERIKNWIAGLPSCFCCDYESYNIIQRGVEFGVLTGTDEKKNEKFVNGWFNVLACRIIQVAVKVGYNLPKHF